MLIVFTKNVFDIYENEELERKKIEKNKTKQKMENNKVNQSNNEEEKRKCKKE